MHCCNSQSGSKGGTCDSQSKGNKSGLDAVKVVLAGQPNVGKSMLINAMSNANRVKVGNYSGVTVETAEICFEHHCHQFDLIDLPGTYSLEGYSKEEKVAKEYLLNEEYDVIVNVVDATHLQRNLLLTLELLQLNKKMVIALNMADEARQEGIVIDTKQLEKIIGAPIVLVSAKTREGVDELLDRVHQLADSNSRSHSNIIYSDAFETEVETIKSFLDKKSFRYKDWTNREVAIALLFENKDLYRVIHEDPIIVELYPLITDSLEHIYIHHETRDLQEVKANEFYAIAYGLSSETVTSNRARGYKDFTKKIDALLLHKYLGIPIFLFFMWALFQATFDFGNIPMDYIDSAIRSLGEYIGGHINNEELRSLIVDGIIGGVGAVLLFLPNILILYIGIALLETTGYMSRVAFLLDGFFHKFGLHGKSFIPLVTGFGCTVPAYMATRTLKNEKDRLITLFILGFMSCGARLPIYVLFTGAFFSESVAGNMLFLIYISGAFLGLVMAKILRVVVFKGEDEPFVMEMPKYRLPSLKLIWHTVYSNAASYIKKAGTFILLAAVLVWFASNYPKNEALEHSYKAKIASETNTTQKSALENELQAKLLEQSYLGQIGKATEPFFAPLGFDWKLSVALESGLAAKEVVVSTLGVLYSLGEVDESNKSLKEILSKNLTLPIALSFIVFVMIYIPCFAAASVFTKEAGGIKYLIYLFLFTTVTAWVFSFITYRLALLFS